MNTNDAMMKVLAAAKSRAADVLNEAAHWDNWTSGPSEHAASLREESRDLCAAIETILSQMENTQGLLILLKADEITEVHNMSSDLEIIAPNE